MEENFQPAGSIQLEKLSLRQDLSGEEIDLRAMCQELNIYESVDKPFLSGTLVLKDTLALQSVLPIVGMEKVIIKFKTPDPSVLKSVDIELRVLRLDDFQPVNLRTAAYTLVLASEEYIFDLNTQVKKSYTGPISTMVENICKTYLGTQKKVFISETEGERTLTIPSMYPARALRFLAKEAKSPEYAPSDFLFWENLDGFQFKTLSECIKAKPLDSYFAGEKDMRTPTIPPVVGRGTKSTKPQEMQKIDSFTFKHIFTIDKMMTSGAFESSVIVINPMTSYFETKRYNYFNDFDKFKHTTTGQAGKFLPQQTEILSEEGDAFEYLHITNFGDQTVIPEQKHEFINYMVAANALLSGLVCEISVPGDTDRRAGDVVKVQFPEFGGTDDVLTKVNRFLSGEYLVLSVRHMYNANGYRCVMQIAKNCYETDPENAINPLAN